MRIQFTCKAVFRSLIAGVLGVMASDKSDAHELEKTDCQYIETSEKCTESGKSGVAHDECVSREARTGSCERCGSGPCCIRARSQVNSGMTEVQQEELNAIGTRLP